MLLISFFLFLCFSDKARESNESVLVHCLAGISRSPTVAIAYVMRHLQMTCEDAYRYVKAKRATISPNFNFLGQLLEYEKQLVQDNVIEKKQSPVVPLSFTSASQSSVDFVLGPPPPHLPIPVKPPGKRLNLNLRFSPFADPPTLSSPKDSSPTTAMARLQFDKPLGKENRSGSGGNSGGIVPPPPTTLSFAGLSRPTRLVKEQNVTSIQEEEVGHAAWESVSKSLSHHSSSSSSSSLSISISKGFKCRKGSSVEQQISESSSSSSSSSSSKMCGGGCDYGKKFKVHKIHVEGSADSTNKDHVEQCGEENNAVEPVPSCLPSSILNSGCSSASISSGGGDTSHSSSGINVVGLSPVACYKREFSRSDSVSTSGIGSEISENELQASGSWEMSESGNLNDDGVFSDSCSGFSKSPRRQLQVSYC